MPIDTVSPASAFPDISQGTWSPPTPTTPVDEYEARGDQLWEDLFAAHQGSLDDALKGVGARTAAEQRRMAEMSEGSALGGGFQSGMAQASLTGQELEWQARTEHAQRGIDLQMAQLENMYAKAEAAKDRQAQADIQEKINTLMMQQELLRQGVQGVTFDEEGNIARDEEGNIELTEKGAAPGEVVSTDPDNSVDVSYAASFGAGGGPYDLTSTLHYLRNDRAGYQRLISESVAAEKASPQFQQALSTMWTMVPEDWGWGMPELVGARNYMHLFYKSHGRYPSWEATITALKHAGMGGGMFQNLTPGSPGI
jgi:hypothetical protein